VGDLNVYVEGRPAPQGSKRISPTGAMREQSPYLVAWAGGWKGAKRLGKRNHGAVERAVYRWYQEQDVHPAALIGGYIKGPIEVTITFYLDPAHGPIDGPPDIDKLARATFDALTAARAWSDDGAVVETHLRKRAADEHHPSGAYIMIREATL
jgi:crossover junction endodeoxyribonuclease RusA